MVNYRIVIPTYKRPHILKDKTLKLLDSHNIPPERIDILIATPKEGKEYKLVLPEKYHNRIIYHYQKGIGAVRNFIQSYYKYETKEKYLVSIDDDINKILDWDIPIKNLDEFIVDMFYETEVRKLCLWGVSAYHNTFFMKKDISTNLKYICGAFNGTIIDRSKSDIQTEFDHFEDMCFSCEYFLRDGGVVRNNGVSLITKYFEEKGGICESYGGLEERKKDMALASNDVKDRYGDMVRIVEKKFGFDIRLNGFYKIENDL